MATALNGNIFTQYVNSEGNPLVGGNVYYYAAGTTTLQTIYADGGEVNTLPNPMVLGSRGELTSTVFLDGDYKVVVKDADGSQIFERDNFSLTSSATDTAAILQSLGAVLGDWTTVKALVTIVAGDIVLGDNYGGLYKLNVGGDNTLDPESDDYDYKGLGAEWTFLNAVARPHGIKGYWSELDSRSTPIQAGDVVIGSTEKGLYELRTGGTATNDPESDTYTSAGVGTDWFDVVKRNQSNAGSTGTGLPNNTLTGFKVSNGAVDAQHDIDVTAGSCTDSTNAAILTGTAFTKQIDAGWAAGTNGGGLDTGSVAADTEYAFFAIEKDSDSSVDYLFSLSQTSPTMPSGYTEFRRIFSFKTDSSANILPFRQVGDTFFYDVGIVDVDETPGATTEQLKNTSVPAGMIGQFLVEFESNNPSASPNYMLVTSPEQTDTTPSSSIYSLRAQDRLSTWEYVSAAVFDIETDSGGQLRYRTDTTSCAVRVTALGWLDTRGRLD
jgi:hypothetical protein